MPSARQLIRERRGAILLIAIFAAFVGLVIAWVCVGDGPARHWRAPAAIDTLLRAGTGGLIYILAALGWGRAFEPLVRGAEERAGLRAALGLALLLSISHGLGWAGLLDDFFPRFTVLLLGLTLFVSRVVRLRRSPDRRPIVISPVALLALPGAALLAAAACQPPGWLWGSEFGGYDALSYHLQLPREWALLGRIAPLEHNVYSYQPGYLEAAFLHVILLHGAPAAGGPAAGDGTALLACQLLHAGLAFVTAWLLACCVRSAGRTAGIAESATHAGGAFGGALFLATPWIVVVGSLAYNEMGVTALGAAALLAALEKDIPPVRRGVACGLLVGVACGCKPTALLFVGLPVGLVLVGLAPARTWARVALSGAVAGVLALLPWLIRNAAHGGNPVFPYLSGLFGSAHWTAEQAARFHAATIFDGSLLDRFTLLFFQDPGDPAGPRHRGMLHPQWGVFFPLCAVACGTVILVPRTRRIGVLLGAGLLTQVLVWLSASHLQSRFLIPLAIPGCVVIGLAGGLVWRLHRRVGAAIMGGVVCLQILMAGIIYSQEKGGRPNALLLAGPGAFTGALYTDLQEAERLTEPSPEVVLNLSPALGRTYLLGDATPLYFMENVLYSTTWDRSVLADAIRAHPDNPTAWTRALRAEGVDRVLVNFAELDRLARSRFLDPALTPEAVARWVESLGRPAREWNRGRRALFELGPEPAP